MNHNNLKIKNNIVGYDTETTGLIPYGTFERWGHYPSRPFAFSFSDEDGNSAFFRLDVDPFTRRVIPNKSIYKELGAILGNSKISKVGHNLNYDIRMTRLMGIPFAGPVEDTLIMAHVITGGSELSYQLKDLGVRYLEVPRDDEKALEEATKKIRRSAKKLGWKIAEGEAFGKKPHKADTWMAPPELLKTYAVRDAERTIMFKMLWLDEILEDPQAARVYAREMKLFPIVREMENRGVQVFPKCLKELRIFYQAYMDKWLKEANKQGGKDLNFNSPPQLVEEFIKKRKHKPLSLTSKGRPSVDGKFLQSISHQDPLAKAILEYNGGAKMINTFLAPYERFCVPEEKLQIIHPNYRQTGPVTGRFSCGDPNLMQVASPDGGKKRTEVELRPREAFGPRPGHVWYLPDYSQIEVWLFAYSAQEPAMIKALLSGHDFHGSIAKQVWHNRPDFDKEWVHYRKRGKLIMFCKIYGGGAQAVADLLGCTKDEAHVFINEYDSTFPGVRKFMKRMVNRVEREGKIYNPFGRVYYIDSKFSYKATNYYIQGSAADIIKEAMIAVAGLFERRWKGCRLLMTLHDELISEIPLKYHSKLLMREIIQKMQGNFHVPFGIPNPLPISMKITKSQWSSAKEIKL